MLTDTPDLLAGTSWDISTEEFREFDRSTNGIFGQASPSSLSVELFHTNTTPNTEDAMSAAVSPNSSAYADDGLVEIEASTLFNMVGEDSLLGSDMLDIGFEDDSGVSSFDWMESSIDPSISSFLSSLQAEEADLGLDLIEEVSPPPSPEMSPQRSQVYSTRKTLQKRGSRSPTRAAALLSAPPALAAPPGSMSLLPPALRPTRYNIASTPPTTTPKKRKRTATGSRKKANVSTQDTPARHDLMSTIDDLTNTISSKLGLREQLEVLRILNPSACVAPNASEFAIDLESLTEEKLQAVREYIDQHTNEISSIGPQAGRLGSSTCDSDGFSHSSTSSASSSMGGEQSPSSSSFSQKRRTVPKAEQQRNSQLRKMKEKNQRDHEYRVRRRMKSKKERRQTEKEAQSGLFEHEQVISLALDQSASEEDDEDVDILA